MSTIFCFGNRLNDYKYEKKNFFPVVKENIIKNTVPSKVDI